METTPRKSLVITGGRALAPLAAPLGEAFDLVYLYPQSAQDAANFGVQRVSILEQVASVDERNRAENAAVHMAAQVVNHLPDISARFSAAYGERPHPAQLNSKIPEWWAAFVHGRAARVMNLAAQVESVARQTQLAGCLVHEDVTADTRAIVLTCQRLGLPTIHLPHATCHLLPGVKDIHRTATAKHVLAGGEYSRQFYSDVGAQARVVGVPLWDGLINSHLPTKAQARALLKTTAPRVIHYGTTWAQTTSLRSEFGDEIARTLNAVIAHCKNNDAFLMIGMHPNEQPDMIMRYRDALKAQGVSGLVTQNHSTYLAIAADVFVTHGPSNFCLEAAILGTPSAYVQTVDFDYAHPYPVRGPVDSMDVMIEQAIDREGDREEFIRYYNAAYPDGEATRAAVEAVKELCL